MANAYYLVVQILARFQVKSANLHAWGANFHKKIDQFQENNNSRQILCELSCKKKSVKLAIKECGIFGWYKIIAVIVGVNVVKLT